MQKATRADRHRTRTCLHLHHCSSLTGSRPSVGRALTPPRRSTKHTPNPSAWQSDPPPPLFATLAVPSLPAKAAPPSPAPRAAFVMVDIPCFMSCLRNFACTPEKGSHARVFNAVGMDFLPFFFFAQDLGEQGTAGAHTGVFKSHCPIVLLLVN